jgi:hypothetical protein
MFSFFILIIYQVASLGSRHLTYILDGEPLEFIDQCQADRNVEQEGDPEQRREDRLDVECALRA